MPGCLAEVLIRYPSNKAATIARNLYLSSLDKNVSAQLPLGGSFGSNDKSPSRPPKGERCEKQQSSKSNQQGIRDFEPITKERGPEFGSLLLSIIAMAIAFPILAVGQDLWDSKMRWRGGFLVALSIWTGFQSTIGLLFGFDLWSLWRLL